MDSFWPETEYKREFRKLVGVWSEAYEPGMGSGVGYPDLQLLVGRLLLPVELKSGVVFKGNLRPKQVKPSQISWHHDFFMAGGESWVVVCCGDPKYMDAWSVPSVHRDVLSRWRVGWPIQDCTQWVSQGSLSIDLFRRSFLF